MFQMWQCFQFKKHIPSIYLDNLFYIYLRVYCSWVISVCARDRFLSENSDFKICRVQNVTSRTLLSQIYCDFPLHDQLHSGKIWKVTPYKTEYHSLKTLFNSDKIDIKSRLPNWCIFACNIRNELWESFSNKYLKLHSQYF